ncbi:MAG: hypothetical protein WDO12_04300 [Pseudomonadota bacterium]
MHRAGARSQWEWNHNPLDAAWSLTARPGWLRLRALPARIWSRRATRSRRSCRDRQ